MTNYHDHDGTRSLGDYLRPLAAYSVLIIVVTGLTTAAGIAFWRSQPAAYTAEASVLVAPVSIGPGQALVTSEKLDDMSTERRLAGSRLVTGNAVELLATAGHSFEPDAFRKNLRVNLVGDSRILDFHYTSQDPERAALAVDAAAQAFVGYRTEVLETQRDSLSFMLDEETSLLQTELSEIVADVARSENAREALAASDRLESGEAAAERARLRTRQDTLERQLNTSLSAASTLAMVSVEVTRQVDSAEVPTEPDGLGLVPTAAGAGVGGLVIGVVLAYLLASFRARPRPTHPFPAPAAEPMTEPITEPIDQQPTTAYHAVETPSAESIPELRGLPSAETSEVTVDQPEPSELVQAPLHGPPIEPRKVNMPTVTHRQQTPPLDEDGDPIVRLSTVTQPIPASELVDEESEGSELADEAADSEPNDELNDNLNDEPNDELNDNPDDDGAGDGEADRSEDDIPESDSDRGHEERDELDAVQQAIRATVDPLHISTDPDDSFHHLVADLGSDLGKHLELSQTAVASAGFTSTIEQLQQLGAQGSVTVASIGDGSDDPALAVAFELGVQLAGMGAQVLVVDAATSSPHLHQIVGSPLAPGLSEILTGREQLGSAIQEVTGVPGLSVLTRGESAAAIEAGLRGASLARLLGRARLDYHALLLIGGESSSDIVPALAALSDAVLVGTEKPIGSEVDSGLSERLETLSSTTLDVVSVSPLQLSEPDRLSNPKPDDQLDEPDDEYDDQPVNQVDDAHHDSPDEQSNDQPGDQSDGESPHRPVSSAPPPLPPLSAEQRAAARSGVEALIASEFDRIGVLPPIPSSDPSTVGDS